MWRFVHLSDPHLASERDGEWNNRFLCSMMPEVMACLARDLRKIAPDFILATGDIASQQTREAMLSARDLMDSLGFPYYPMGGNHDFVLPDSRAWFLEAFAHQLPAEATYYAFEHKNLRFLVLDPWWLWSDGTLSQISERTVAARMDRDLKGARWVVPPDQLAWLEAELQQKPEMPVLIAVHFPVLRIPDRLRRPDLRDGGCLENGDQFLDLLAEYPQVRAIFSGHVHLHFMEAQKGITQVVTGALPEYPVEYRVVEVHDDYLGISTHGLSDGEFARRSLIAEKHWTRGESQDRQAVVRLRGRS